MRPFPLATALVFALVAAAPLLAATPLPPAVRTMVEAAAKSGDKAKIDAVTAIAKETNPDSGAEIDGIVAGIASEQAAQRAAKLRQAGFFENWAGTGQIGGSFATGNSDVVALAAGLTLGRDGIAWRHALNASADLQRDSGTTTQERFAVNWQSDWKFSERGWLFGRVGWERNQVAGLTSRFTEALGVGYRLVASPRVRWDIEGGPALVQARFTDRRENSFAVRGGTNFLWNINDNLEFSENASVLYQANNTAIQSTTALTAKLFDALSARFSFTIAHETDPPAGLERTDTVTRATLVYDF